MTAAGLRRKACTSLREKLLVCVLDSPLNKKLNDQLPACYRSEIVSIPATDLSAGAIADVLKLDELLQSYYDLDYEDIIGGGAVKTRFKYTSVPKEDFGLTEEEIFLLDDK